MKRHHIVGIFLVIGAIGLAIRSALSGNIVEALLYFTALSTIAVSSFFKDKFSPRWSQRTLPFWMCVVLVCLTLFEMIFDFLY